MRILSLSALAGVVSGSASACDLCSIYSATLARGEIGKGFYAGFAEQFTHFGTVQVDGRKAPNEAGQYLDSSISQLFVGYNLKDRIGVQFNLPVIYRSFKRPAGFEIDRGTESGIGDVSLIGNFLVYRSLKEDFTFSGSVLAGIKFPTGSTDTFQGASADDTGVTAVYLGPQLSFTWLSKLSGHVGADLPVSIDNTALQTVPDYRVRAAVHWRF